MGAAQQFGQAVVALRAEDEIDPLGAADDLVPLGLGDAAGDADLEVLAAQQRPLLAHLAQAAQFGKDLLGGLFADMAGVEHDEVGVFEHLGLLIALGGQRIRHTIGIVDVHLAAIGLDEDALWFWCSRHISRVAGDGAKVLAPYRSSS